MQADEWISAAALPLFSLLDCTVVLHPRQEARSRGDDFMAASAGLDRKLERGAKRCGDTFHLFPLTFAGVYARRVCGIVSLAVLSLSVLPFCLSPLRSPLYMSRDLFSSLSLPPALFGFLTFYRHQF